MNRLYSFCIRLFLSLKKSFYIVGDDFIIFFRYKVCSLYYSMLVEFNFCIWEVEAQGKTDGI